MLVVGNCQGGEAAVKEHVGMRKGWAYLEFL